MAAQFFVGTERPLKSAVPGCSLQLTSPMWPLMGTSACYRAEVSLIAWVALGGLVGSPSQQLLLKRNVMPMTFLSQTSVKARGSESWVTCLVACLLTLSFSLSTAGQSTAKKLGRPEAESENLDTQRWRFMLDGLNDEGRTLLLEKNRPYAVAGVADAYWNLDKIRSAALFKAALEAALELKSGNRETSLALRHVILLAARRDVSLARKLAEELASRMAKSEKPSSESVGAAIDLLRIDAKTAAELAEAVAPTGLSDDSAGVFILELAARDLSASERVYRTYLSKFAAKPDLPLNQILWLGGYPFGYGETYGFSNANFSRLVGLGGRSIKGLSANPTLAVAFLNVAFNSVQSTLNRAVLSPQEKKESLNGLCLFATLYLLPEVERYSANRSEAWWLLRQQALAGTSQAQREMFEKQLQMVSQNRATAKNRDDSVETSPNDKIEGDLADADKMPQGCPRDRAYAKTGLLVHSAKDDYRALRIADRIDNGSVRDSVRQFLYYDISLTLLDAGDWPQAQQYAKRVAAPELRSLLYMKMAGTALRQKDQALAAESLTEALHLAEDISDPATKAGVLLATSAAFAKFDLIRTMEVLGEAIKAVNRVKDPNVDSFSIMRRIELSCSDGPADMWYGSSERAERFSLMATLTSLSTLDPEGMLAIGRNLEEPSVRIRALASIIGSLAAPKPLKSTRAS